MSRLSVAPQLVIDRMDACRDDLVRIVRYKDKLITELEEENSKLKARLEKIEEENK